MKSKPSLCTSVTLSFLCIPFLNAMETTENDVRVPSKEVVKRHKKRYHKKAWGTDTDNMTLKEELSLRRIQHHRAHLAKMYHENNRTQNPYNKDIQVSCTTWAEKSFVQRTRKEELTIIDQQKRVVSAQFMQQLNERQNKKSWDEFYKKTVAERNEIGEQIVQQLKETCVQLTQQLDQEIDADQQDLLSSQLEQSCSDLKKEFEQNPELAQNLDNSWFSYLPTWFTYNYWWTSQSTNQ